MICPFCREKDTSVIDSRATEMVQPLDEDVFAHVEADKVSTFERVQFRELTVVKKNGRKVHSERKISQVSLSH